MNPRPSTPHHGNGTPEVAVPDEAASAVDGKGTSRRAFVRGVAMVGGAAAAVYAKPSMNGLGVLRAHAVSGIVQPPPPPPTTQLTACSHGFWKNHEEAWPAPFTPSTPFSVAFGRTITLQGPGQGHGSGSTTDPTLMQALDMGGGHLNALAREAVAALLNAADPLLHPAVRFNTTAKVIAAFKAAFDSGDFETLKDALDASNNLGCPLR